MTKNKQRKKKYVWDYFDDCAICQAVKEGKASTEKELREAFKKQEEKNEKYYER